MPMTTTTTTTSKDSWDHLARHSISDEVSQYVSANKLHFPNSDFTKLCNWNL